MGAEIRQKMRKQALAKRDLLGIRDRHEKSAAITERILSMPGMDSWETLFVYVNFRSEVETLQLIQRCLEKDKRVVVPLVDSAQSTMIALQVTDLEEDLQPGYFDRQRL
jgi:5-formyltetrahydrofolate cyclo-ligase